MNVEVANDLITQYGKARLEPTDPVIAGTLGTWKIHYRVGKYGIDCFGAITVLFHSSSDWELPQLDDPVAPSYTSVSHDGDSSVELVCQFDPVGGIRPFSRRLLIRVTDGSLAEGDNVTIVMGDQGGGSIGCRAQSFAGDVILKILTDPFATGLFQHVSSPTLTIIPGPATSLAITGPSDMLIDQPASLTVCAFDQWGNRTSYVGHVAIADADRHLASYQFVPSDMGVCQVDDIVFGQAGFHWIQAVTDDGLEAISNPIRVHKSASEYKLLWGDTQSQSGETVGGGTLDQFFTYADSVARLDFVVHSANDFQISDELWTQIREANNHYYVPGRFVTLLGYEWSGNTSTGGDHSVIFSNSRGPLHRSSHALVDDLTDIASDRNPVDKLFEEFAGRDDAIAIPHIGGRRANLDFVCEEVVPAIEIVSCHGHFEWFAREAIRRELKVGFVGATDDHSGRPGASFPCNNDLRVRGGLTGVYAKERTRTEVWNALRNRHCYATTGARMILSVYCGDAIMGDELVENGPFAVDVEVVGTAPLECVEILRNEEVQLIEKIALPSEKIRVTWSGARTDSRCRLTNWDGHIGLSAGTIRTAMKWAFDRPIDDAWLDNDQCVRWKSSTVGDWDGVILDIDAPKTAVLSLDAGPARLDVSLESITNSDSPQLWDLGGVDQRVVIGRAPKSDGPRDARFHWEETSSRPGLNFYWVRATQIDGEIAWSSPIIYTDRTLR